MSEAKSLDVVARELAVAHQESDPGTREVYLDPDPEGREIRLVEVTESVNTAGEVLPYWFEPDEGQGVPFPAVVVLLSPDDWQRCRDGQLPLPSGWGEPTGLRKLA